MIKNYLKVIKTMCRNIYKNIKQIKKYNKKL